MSRKLDEALVCAKLRSDFWRKLGMALKESDPRRSDRLFGMADGIDFFVADLKHGTDGSELASWQKQELAKTRRSALNS